MTLEQQQLHKGLPCLVERCVQYLEKEYVQGLFLTNGNAGNIRRLRQAFRDNPDTDLVLLKTKFPRFTPLDVAAMLCNFLRNMPGDPIIGNDCLLPLSEAAGSPVTARTVNIKRTIRSLVPQRRARVLRRISVYLHSLCKRGVSVDALSRVFAPIFFGKYKKSVMSGVMWTHVTTQITGLLIEEADAIFTDHLAREQSRRLNSSNRVTQKVNATSIAVDTSRPIAKSTSTRVKIPVPFAVKRTSSGETGQLLFHRSLTMMESPSTSILGGRRRKLAGSKPPLYKAQPTLVRSATSPRRKMSAPALTTPTKKQAPSAAAKGGSPALSKARNMRKGSVPAAPIGSGHKAPTWSPQKGLNKVSSYQKLVVSTHERQASHAGYEIFRTLTKQNVHSDVPAPVPRRKGPIPPGTKHQLLIVKLTIQAQLRNTSRKNHGHGKEWLKSLKPKMTDDPTLVEWLSTNGRELVEALNRTETSLLLQGILLDKNGGQLEVEPLLEQTLKEVADTLASES